MSAEIKVVVDAMGGDNAPQAPVHGAVDALNEVENITIILITHYMEEVIYAHRVFVMDKGQVKMQGTSREIFSQVEKLKSLRLDVPQVTLLAYELKKSGISLPDGILTTEELTDALQRYSMLL